MKLRAYLHLLFLLTASLATARAESAPLWRIDADAAHLPALAIVLAKPGFAKIVEAGAALGVGHPNSAGACVTGHLIDGELSVAAVIDTLSNELILHQAMTALAGPPNDGGAYRLHANGPLLTPRGRTIVIAVNQAAIDKLPLQVRPDRATEGLRFTAALAKFPDKIKPRAAALQGVDKLTLTAKQLRDGWQLALSLTAPNPEQARQTTQIVNGLIAFSRAASADRPTMAAIAAKSLVKVENTTISVSVRAKDAHLRELLQPKPPSAPPAQASQPVKFVE